MVSSDPITFAQHLASDLPLDCDILDADISKCDKRLSFPGTTWIHRAVGESSWSRVGGVADGS